MFLVDLVFHDNPSGETQGIKCTYSVEQGLWQIGVLLFQGSTLKDLRDFGDPVIHIYMERLGFDRACFGVLAQAQPYGRGS
jgi:hypothetical protein